jgi:hypothetical protein
LKIFPLHKSDKEEEHGRHKQDGNLATGLLCSSLISVGCVNSDGNTSPDPCKKQKTRPSKHQNGGKGAEQDEWNEFPYGINDAPQLPYASLGRQSELTDENLFLPLLRIGIGALHVKEILPSGDIDLISYRIQQVVP